MHCINCMAHVLCLLAKQAGLHCNFNTQPSPATHMGCCCLALADAFLHTGVSFVTCWHNSDTMHPLYSVQCLMQLCQGMPLESFKALAEPHCRLGSSSL